MAGATRHLFFISNERGHILSDRVCGAPDLVVEVVSPDSTARDYRDKFDDYRANGVKEYWVVNPITQTLNVYELEKQEYKQIAEKHGLVRSKVLKGFFVKPAWLWYHPFPKLNVVLREMGVR